MKKLVIGLVASLGIFGGLAFGGCKTYQCVKAEEEIVEPIASGGEEIAPIEEEPISAIEGLSQWAVDSIAVVKEVLNQPIVIGGVSITLGALILLIITKLVGNVSKRKISEKLGEISNIYDKLKEYATLKDYNSLLATCKTLISVNKELIDNCKNVKVKEKCKELIKELEPVVDEAVEFAINEKDLVVEDSKEQLEKSANKVIDILNRD